MTLEDTLSIIYKMAIDTYEATYPNGEDDEMICICCGQPLTTHTIPAYKTIPARNMVDCRNPQCCAYMITASEKTYTETLTNYLKEKNCDRPDVPLNP